VCGRKTKRRKRLSNRAKGSTEGKEIPQVASLKVQIQWTDIFLPGTGEIQNSEDRVGRGVFVANQPVRKHRGRRIQRAIRERSEKGSERYVFKKKRRSPQCHALSIPELEKGSKEGADRGTFLQNPSKKSRRHTPVRGIRFKAKWGQTMVKKSRWGGQEKTEKGLLHVVEERIAPTSTLPS